MRFLDYISIPILIISFIVGVLYNYVLSDVKKQIFVYPTPETAGLYAFQDLAGNCFDLQMHELECKDAAKEIPPQRESDDPSNKVESKGFVMSALKYTH